MRRGALCYATKGGLQGRKVPFRHECPLWVRSGHFRPATLNDRFTPKAVIRSQSAQWLLLTQSGRKSGNPKSAFKRSQQWGIGDAKDSR
jgi:hypothetical protein